MLKGTWCCQEERSVKPSVVVDVITPLMIAANKHTFGHCAFADVHWDPESNGLTVTDKVPSEPLT